MLQETYQIRIKDEQVAYDEKSQDELMEQTLGTLNKNFHNKIFVVIEPVNSGKRFAITILERDINKAKIIADDIVKILKEKCNCESTLHKVKLLWYDYFSYTETIY